MQKTIIKKRKLTKEALLRKKKKRKFFQNIFCILREIVPMLIASASSLYAGIYLIQEAIEWVIIPSLVTIILSLVAGISGILMIVIGLIFLLLAIWHITIFKSL